MNYVMLFDTVLKCDLERGSATRPILVLIKVRALGFLHNGTCSFGMSGGKFDSASVAKSPLDTC